MQRSTLFLLFCGTARPAPRRIARPNHRAAARAAIPSRCVLAVALLSVEAFAPTALPVQNRMRLATSSTRPAAAVGLRMSAADSVRALPRDALVLRDHTRIRCRTGKLERASACKCTRRAYMWSHLLRHDLIISSTRLCKHARTHHRERHGDSLCVG